MSPVRRLFRREDGTAAIEFALIGMLLIVVSVGTIEVGRALFLYNELAHAADRAARLILLGRDDAEVESGVKQPDRLVSLSPDLLSVIPGKTTLEEGGVVIPFRTVQLKYPFTPMISGLTIGSFTLSTDRRVPNS